MNRSRLLAAAVSLVCMTSASPAHAWLGDGWLERLSGPGPFKGLSYDIRLVCLASPDRDAEDGIQKHLDSDAESIGKSLTWPKRDRGPWLGLAGCHFLLPSEHRLEVGLLVGRMRAEGSDNHLDYTDRPEIAALNREVRLHTFLVTADWRVNRVLDLGAGIGRAAFSSEAEIFQSFDRLVFQPLRVTSRPLSAFSRDRRAEAVQLRFDTTLFAGGYSDADFGARQGTFNEPGELVWGWAVIVDASAFLW